MAFVVGGIGCSSDPVEEPPPAPVPDAESSTDTVAPVDETPQILFGDLHVHSTHSLDAMILNSPILSGRGWSGPAVRCDFARFCSQLDFWSINDHPELGAPELWQTTREAIRTCNDLEGGDEPNAGMVSFLGWEWTQVGETVATDWGHKNVLLRDTADSDTPTRPVAAGRTAGTFGPVLLQSLDDLAVAVDPDNEDFYTELGELIDKGTTAELCEKGVDTRSLPTDCAELADDPAELYEKLDQWGFETLVIPHGTTWGAHHPLLASWKPQMNLLQHRPDYERLVEVYSGHGNMEQYRPWRAVDEAADGTRTCPAPSDGFLPCCWRAGEIAAEKDPLCADDATSEACLQRVKTARQEYVDAELTGASTLNYATPADWLDCGQCSDCYEPAFNHRPGFTAQAALAMTNFDDAVPWRYTFGLIGSTDSHRAGPGAGYKEGREMSDAAGAANPDFDDLVAFGGPLLFPEWERQQSYFFSGGLVAVHSLGRNRGAIWDALKRREVYATSGERILLWFDLLDGNVRTVMGSQVKRDEAPTFEVRAVGSWKQAPGCAQATKDRAPAGFIEEACFGECYNPTDERHRITRIEVVKITPQTSADEALDGLITDPWRVHECTSGPEGCTATFTDEDYAAGGRPAVYYARVFQEATDQFNAGGVRCERDEQGRCTSVSLCPVGYDKGSDTCLTKAEERAWSSPIYLAPKP